VLGTRTSATAFAPASVGNVAIGFDILGFSVDALGDRATVWRRERGAAATAGAATGAAGVRISAIRGVVQDLPPEAARNTAGRALMAMQEALGLDCELELQLDKGIPLSSGLGGSAASAVAAVVAANALLAEPRPLAELLKYAVQGEAVASGSVHVDNIAPSLYGGLVLTVGIDHPRVKQIPVPEAIRAVIVHPHMLLSTREARAILRRSVEMADFVWQTANLAGFISGCYTSDLDLLRESFEDVVIEPQRAALIPGFAAVRRAALAAGAIGCSISGAGPTVFAWCLTSEAQTVRAAMVQEFAQHGLDSDHWVSSVVPVGAHVID
jgi:homoserine kinase